MAQGVFCSDSRAGNWKLKKTSTSLTRYMKVTTLALKTLQHCVYVTLQPCDIPYAWLISLLCPDQRVSELSIHLTWRGTPMPHTWTKSNFTSLKAGFKIHECLSVKYSQPVGWVLRGVDGHWLSQTRSLSTVYTWLARFSLLKPHAVDRHSIRGVPQLGLFHSSIFNATNTIFTFNAPQGSTQLGKH